MSVFRDHFSGHASDYAAYRPTYPPDLFDALAAHVDTRARALDVATGNGQAALALAERFASVFATDASAEQIAAALPHPAVTYAVRPAHDSGLPGGSVDLITVAQALHWFDPEPFHAEVERVLRPGGVVAAWCYELFTVDASFDAVMLELYHDVLGADWPPERRHIEAGYRTLPWPWPACPMPSVAMRAAWTVDQALGYLRTWSATRRYWQREGVDPVAAMEPRLRSAWGADAVRPVHWPLTVKVARVR